MADDPLVHRLPNELLVKLFECIRGDDWSDDWCGVITQTHVCRRWRDVSLAAPILWTKIDLRRMSIHVAQCFLNRPATAPLRVVLDTSVIHCYNPPIPEELAQSEEHKAQLTMGIIDMLSPVTPRITYLQLQHPHNYPTIEITSLLSRPFPALETLELWVAPQVSGTVWPQVAAPLLKDISLCAVKFEGLWDADMLSRLVSLTLIDLHPSNRLPLRKFIDMLSNCPRLERLVLHPGFLADSSQEETIPPTPRPPQIKQLVSLTHLEIQQGELIQMIAFLSCLRFPVIERLLVDISRPSQLTEQAWKDFLSFDRTPFATLIRRSRSLCFRMGRGSLYVAERPTLLGDGAYKLCIAFEPEWSSELITFAVNACLAEISRHDTYIKTLHLDLAESVDCRALSRNIFASIPSLVTLHIYSWCWSEPEPGKELTQAVCDVLGSVPDAGEEPVTCPLAFLERIILHLTVSGFPGITDAAMNALIAALTARKALGVVLQTLTIRLDISSWDAEPDLDVFVTRLQALVKNVNCHIGVRR